LFPDGGAGLELVPDRLEQVEDAAVASGHLREQTGWLDRPDGRQTAGGGVGGTTQRGGELADALDRYRPVDGRELPEAAFELPQFVEQSRRRGGDPFALDRHRADDVQVLADDRGPLERSQGHVLQQLVGGAELLTSLADGVGGRVQVRLGGGVPGQWQE
jgi:hypothetical protein